MSNDFIFGLKFSLVGMVIVFISLIIISFSIRLMRMLDERASKLGKPKDEISKPEEQNVDNLTLVLISAAAAATVNKKFKIKSVRRMVSRDSAGSWTVQGRSVLHGSHVLNLKSDK